MQAEVDRETIVQYECDSEAYAKKMKEFRKESDTLKQEFDKLLISIEDVARMTDKEKRAHAEKLEVHWKKRQKHTESRAALQNEEPTHPSAALQRVKARMSRQY